MSQNDKEEARRLHDRQTVVYEARISFGGNFFDCQILNISAGGARARVVKKFEESGPVVLSLDPFGDFPCDISWNDGKNLGVRFKGDPAAMAEVVMAIAVYGSVKRELPKNKK